MGKQERVVCLMAGICICVFILCLSQIKCEPNPPSWQSKEAHEKARIYYGTPPDGP